MDQGWLINEVAAVQDSDPGRLNFPTFGGLRNFIRLDLERDLHNLEGKLERLDKSEATKCNERQLSRKNFDDIGPRSSRHELLAKVQEILMEYDELRLRSEAIQALATAKERDSNSVYNVAYTSQSIDHADQERLFRTDDLATLSRDANRGRTDEVRVSPFSHVCPSIFVVYQPCGKRVPQISDVIQMLPAYDFLLSNSWYTMNSGFEIWRTRSGIISRSRHRPERLTSTSIGPVPDERIKAGTSAFHLLTLPRATVTTLSSLLLLAVVLAYFTLLPRNDQEAQRKGT